MHLLWTIGSLTLSRLLHFSSRPSPSLWTLKCNIVTAIFHKAKIHILFPTCKPSRATTRPQTVLTSCGQTSASSATSQTSMLNTKIKVRLEETTSTSHRTVASFTKARFACSETDATSATSTGASKRSTGTSIWRTLVPLSSLLTKFSLIASRCLMATTLILTSRRKSGSKLSNFSRPLCSPRSPFRPSALCLVLAASLQSRLRTA